jgi:hypothetical protein
MGKKDGKAMTIENDDDRENAQQQLPHLFVAIDSLAEAHSSTSVVEWQVATTH